ncbi:MAG: class E sortase [Actinobacteria bacterium]|nr:class E sortase [Actinomycetota bacterium]
MSEEDRPKSPSWKMRSVLRILTVAAATLLLVGGGLLAHPYYTDLQADQAQQALAAEFATDSTKEAYVQKDVPDGSPVTRLRISKLGLDTLVVEGATDESLRSGAARYSHTSMPGEPGNVGIAGHRTTYGKPFHDLDLLGPGDRVMLDTPVGSYVYETVEPFDGHANPWIVTPEAVEVVGPTEEDSLTLTTCHPKGSDRERLIARLKLVKSPDDP